MIILIPLGLESMSLSTDQKILVSIFDSGVGFFSTRELFGGKYGLAFSLSCLAEVPALHRSKVMGGPTVVFMFLYVIQSNFLHYRVWL